MEDDTHTTTLPRHAASIVHVTSEAAADWAQRRRKHAAVAPTSSSAARTYKIVIPAVDATHDAGSSQSAEILVKPTIAAPQPALRPHSSAPIGRHMTDDDDASPHLSAEDVAVAVSRTAALAAARAAPPPPFQLSFDGDRPLSLTELAEAPLPRNSFSSEDNAPFIGGTGSGGAEREGDEPQGETRNSRRVSFDSGAVQQPANRAPRPPLLETHHAPLLRRDAARDATGGYSNAQRRATGAVGLSPSAPTTRNAISLPSRFKLGSVASPAPQISTRLDDSRAGITTAIHTSSTRKGRTLQRSRSPLRQAGDVAAAAVVTPAAIPNNTTRAIPSANSVVNDAVSPARTTAETAPESLQQMATDADSSMSSRIAEVRDRIAAYVPAALRRVATAVLGEEDAALLLPSEVVTASQSEHQTVAVADARTSEQLGAIRATQQRVRGADIGHAIPARDAPSGNDASNAVPRRRASTPPAWASRAAPPGTAGGYAPHSRTSLATSRRRSSAVVAFGSSKPRDIVASTTQAALRSTRRSSSMPRLRSTTTKAASGNESRVQTAASVLSRSPNETSPPAARMRGRTMAISARRPPLLSSTGVLPPAPRRSVVLPGDESGNVSAPRPVPIAPSKLGVESGATESPPAAATVVPGPASTSQLAKLADARAKSTQLAALIKDLADQVATNHATTLRMRGVSRAERSTSMATLADAVAAAAATVSPSAQLINTSRKTAAVPTASGRIRSPPRRAPPISDVKSGIDMLPAQLDSEYSPSRHELLAHELSTVVGAADGAEWAAATAARVAPPSPTVQELTADRMRMLRVKFSPPPLSPPLPANVALQRSRDVDTIRSAEPRKHDESRQTGSRDVRKIVGDVTTSTKRQRRSRSKRVSSSLSASPTHGVAADRDLDAKSRTAYAEDARRSPSTRGGTIALTENNAPLSSTPTRMALGGHVDSVDAPQSVKKLSPSIEALSKLLDAAAREMRSFRFDEPAMDNHPKATTAATAPPSLMPAASEKEDCALTRNPSWTIQRMLASSGP